MGKGKIITASLISLSLLIICAALSLAMGSRQVPIAGVADVLRGAERDSFDAIVVMERIPRTIFSLLAGAALGVSGILMQSVTRNPIADPSILGVNSGAALFVVCGIAFFQISSAWEYIILALIGAALTSIFVYGIGSIGSGGATPLKLALAGTAAATALSSLTNIIMMPKDRVMDAFRFWQIGSTSGATFEKINAMLPAVITGIVLGFCLSPSLNILALGDDTATGLGAKPQLIRMLGALSGVLLCGTVTALAGPIGFVGLMVPHIMRLVFGNDMRILVPLSAIGGAVLLTISDVIGRIIGSPGEVEVGIVTAVLGGPVFVIIAMKAKVRSL